MVEHVYTFIDFLKLQINARRFFLFLGSALLEIDMDGFYYCIR